MVRPDRLCGLGALAALFGRFTPAGRRNRIVLLAGIDAPELDQTYGQKTKFATIALVAPGLALDWARYSGGSYRHLEPDGGRKRLWRVDAKHKAASRWTRPRSLNIVRHLIGQ